MSFEDRNLEYEYAFRVSPQLSECFGGGVFPVESMHVDDMGYQRLDAALLPYRGVVLSLFTGPGVE